MKNVLLFVGIAWLILITTATYATVLSFFFLIFYFVRPTWVRRSSLGLLVASILLGIGA